MVIFDEDTPERLIKAIRPHVLVKGADWELKDILELDTAIDSHLSTSP